MARASEQVRRMLALIPYLYAHPRSSVHELAELLSVPVKTIVSDLNNIWLSGSSFELERMVEVTWDDQDTYVTLGNADYFAHPQRFRFSEATTLLAGLQTLRANLDAAGIEACDSAAKKLQSALLERDRTAKVEIELSSGELEIRQALLDALESSHQVLLVYHGQARGEITRPIVDPVRLINQDGVTYLQGWSFEAAGWRLYRLDRIEEVDILDETSQHHDGLPDATNGWLEQATQKHVVELELAPAASWVTLMYPVQSVEPLPNGGQRVILDVVNERWFAKLLLTLGGDVESLDPKEAGRLALAQATEALGLYETLDAR